MLYDSDNDAFSMPNLPPLTVSETELLCGTPPPRHCLAPKKRKVADKYAKARRTFWWQPTPNDVCKEILIKKLIKLDPDTIAIVFEFTDFWTLLAAESLGPNDIGNAAKKELRRRLKF